MHLPTGIALDNVLEVTQAVATNSDGYVVDKPVYRKAADTGVGWRNANLRTQFLKVLGRAKVQSWPRLFHSMRASHQTELEKDFSLHVVCSWLGNSPKVAQRSYLLVTSDDFQKAIQGVEKSGTKSGTVKRNSGTISGTASASTVSQNVAKAQAKQGSDDVSLGKHLEKQADGEGFEHASNSLGNSDFSTQAARNPARSAMETLLLELWNAATDSAKLQALELLRLNPSS